VADPLAELVALGVGSFTLHGEMGLLLSLFPLPMRSVSLVVRPQRLCQGRCVPRALVLAVLRSTLPHLVLRALRLSLGMVLRVARSRLVVSR